MLDEQIGSSFAHYRIDARIGAGGMGEVYRAHDGKLGREVAIKVLPSTFSEDQDRLRRFEQEARSAGSLNHPNILVIHEIGSHDGAPYIVSELLDGETLGWLQFLPDGRQFLFFTGRVSGALSGYRETGIHVGSLDSSETKLLMATESPTRAQYARPGYLLYAREGTLLAQEFDVNNLRLTGEPLKVVERIPYFDKTGWSEFSLSENGVLAHMENIGMGRLTWFDRSGRKTGEIGTAGENYGLRLSLDGQKVAMTTVDKQTGSGDLWIHDIARNTRTRLTASAADDADPAWSPDGRRVTFFSCCEGGKSTLRIKELSDTTTTGQPPFETGFLVPEDWSSDGQFIIYDKGDPTTQRDLWVLPLSGDQKEYPLVQTQFEETRARFSPDGRWVAFISNESGRDEIYVTSFANPGEKWQISTVGGRSPRWRRDGEELFYLAPDKTLMSVSINSSTVFDAGTPTTLFRAESILEGDYDVTADGQKFLINSSVAGAQSSPFTVVLNWTADLKR